jgi:putative aldouronate transport system substrate-binding protein
MKKLLSLLLVMALCLALTPVLASDFVGYEEKDVKKDFSDLPTLNARFIYHPLIGTMEQKGVDYQYNRLTNAHREGSGINIQLTHALVDGTEETNKQAMILASGDVPDLMFVPSLSTYMEWAAQGLYMPVDEYLKDMPNYMALVPQEARDACTIDGKLYCFPGSHEETEMKGGGGIVVRYDLYKELGLEKEPQTAQEYYEMWLLVKEKYPDMIPFVGREFATMQAAFGVLSPTVQQEDGSWIFSWTTEAYREYLTYMRKLYEEGILDPEYVNYNTTILQERYVTGKAFSSCEGWASPCVVINGVFAAIPGSELAYLTQMTKDAETPAELLEIFPVQRFNAIPLGAKNPELAAKWIEYMSTEQAKKIQDYGVEGMDYTVDADGKIVQSLDEQNWVGWKIAYEYIPTAPSFYVRLYAKNFDWSFNGLLAARERSNVKVVKHIPDFLPANEEYIELTQQLGLSAYVSEQTDKFIMGERSLDEFDAFQQELKDRGIERYTKALNDWVDMYK